MTRKIIIGVIIILMILSVVSCAQVPASQEPSVIPVPVSMEAGTGYFLLRPGLEINRPEGTEEAETLAQYLAERLSVALGSEIAVVRGKSTKNRITLALDPRLEPRTGPEGYQFHSSKKGILIEAAQPAGLFYGIQTLFQLLPPEIYGEVAVNGVDWKVPSVTILDRPAYSWRGMHLDVSRHFFPKTFIMKYIDLIAMHKMNTFHWHLTDDNGWRIEIKKYPLLTDIAAWRVDREDKPWGDRELQKPGEDATYGGFYTQDDIREIVQYAAERHVTVVPEIEMPGHSSEVFAAYPEYSCRGERLTVLPGSYWPNSDIFCAGKEETFSFLEDILTEVAELFPSPYIHIGGDEADKTVWKQCPLCQQRLREEGLADENELQSYFIRRIEKVLQSKGKKLIGWDEILEGGLAPEATVMSWRGFEGGIEAAQQGHDVIMCPVSHCYFDYYQADPVTEPVAIGGYTLLKKVYSFRPTPPVLTGEEQKHILGAQGNVWTEYIPTPEHAEYMAVPRMTALAEVVWSPEEKLSWDDFSRRMPAQMARLDAMGVNYNRSSYEESNRTVPVHEHLGLNKSYTYQHEPSYKYKGEGPFPLTDGKLGTGIYQDGQWVGFDGNDMEVLIDLGETMDVFHLETHFLHDQKRWIFAPKEVTFSWSVDGVEFTDFKKDNRDFDIRSDKPQILPVIVEFEDAKKMRYVRVQAISQGTCPEWHPGAGEKAWIFSDEIVLK